MSLLIRGGGARRRSIPPRPPAVARSASAAGDADRRTSPQGAGAPEPDPG